MAKIEKLINFFYSLLFLLIPLVIWPYTSEVFEFNKLVVVYILTILILLAWVIRMILERKIIFRRTLLDIPLLFFFGSQLLSTIFSIDFVTSLFGYYSRFNGGLLSTISYLILYWAYVSNIKKENVKKHLIVLIISSFIASVAAILEHFGIFLTCGIIGSITTNCWQQDVQTRVFSTFGQPNWLAAWIAAISPVAWFFLLKEKFKIKSYKSWIWILISLIFWATLLFTRSRSGLAGYATSFIIFWSYVFFKDREKLQEKIKPLVALSFSLLAAGSIFGTPWTPRIDEILTHKITSTNESAQGPALEVGGTESGTIRKIVWKGALHVWLHYPILGSGVETFAYSYYQYRPQAHNLVSEWDFIYNKAHNEYLNFMATTGTLGIAAYLFLIGASIYLMLKNFQSNPNLKIALIAGYTSILITDFFGFAVVPIETLFFLFPAFAIGTTASEEVKAKSEKVSTNQKILIIALLALTFYFLLLISKYWQADALYAKGKSFNTVGKPEVGVPLLESAIKFEPYQALYYSEISGSYALLAVNANDKKDAASTKNYINEAVTESQKALDLSPANLNIRRSRFGIFIRLSAVDPQFLVLARDTLIEAIKLAPTDAKLFYNLGLTQARTGQIDESRATLEKTIELKPNYRDARLAYALLLINKKEYQKAKDQLNYILTKIDPNDILTKQTLQEIK